MAAARDSGLSRGSCHTSACRARPAQLGKGLAAEGGAKRVTLRTCSRTAPQSGKLYYVFLLHVHRISWSRARGVASGRRARGVAPGCWRIRVLGPSLGLVARALLLEALDLALLLALLLLPLTCARRPLHREPTLAPPRPARTHASRGRCTPPPNPTRARALGRSPSTR